MKQGVDTPRGYLGHTGSVTVVTHNVITSGQLPKHMGWTDEGYRDVAGVHGDPTRRPRRRHLHHQQLRLTADVRAAGCGRLPQARRVPRDRGPDGEDLQISPKGYAAYAFGSAKTDSIITFSSGTCENVAGRWRKPGGIDLPPYILGDPCSRFWVHSGYPVDPAVDTNYAYDTTKLPAGALPARQRPLRDRATTRPTRAATSGPRTRRSRSCANEANWNGIFVTMPGVDKAAHMWGGVDDPSRPAPTVTR